MSKKHKPTQSFWQLQFQSKNPTIVATFVCAKLFPLRASRRGRLEARGCEAGRSVSRKYIILEVRKSGTPESHGGKWQWNGIEWRGMASIQWNRMWCGMEWSGCNGWKWNGMEGMKWMEWFAWNGMCRSCWCVFHELCRAYKFPILMGHQGNCMHCWNIQKHLHKVQSNIFCRTCFVDANSCHFC